MPSSGTTLASGTRASLRYARESTRGTTPAGVTTPVTELTAIAGATSTTPYGEFMRNDSGSFITDGFMKGQKVTTSLFSNAANNGTWTVFSVTDDTLTVHDTGSVIVDETTGSGQQVVISLVNIRATGRNVNLERNILESQEVDVDGQESDVRHGFNRVVGSPGFQLSRESFDDLLEMAMGGEYALGSTIGTSDVNLSASASGFVQRVSGDFGTDGFRAGDVVELAGFTNTILNTQWIVTQISGNGTRLVVHDPNGVFLAESSGSGKTVTLVGKRIDVGTNVETMVLERAFSDVSQFQLFNGVAINEMQFTVEPESMIGGTMNLLGMSAAAMSSSSVSSYDSIPSATYSPYAAFDGLIFEGGSLIGVVTSANFTFARGRSLNPVVGSKFSPDVFSGTGKVDGTLSLYFEDATQYNKFFNETESTIVQRFNDPTDPTEFMIVTIPRVKYTGAPMDPPQEGPITLEMPFKGLKKSGLYDGDGNAVATQLTIQLSTGLDV